MNILIYLFIPRSPWQALSRRVAHHTERRPCSLLFRALRPVRLVKCQRPKHCKPTRSSCAAKRSRCVPWTASRGRWQSQRHGSIHHPRSSEQPDKVWPSGNARYRSRSRRGDGHFGPLHGNDGWVSETTAWRRSSSSADHVAFPV